MGTAFALRCLHVFKNTSWFSGHGVGDKTARWGYISGDLREEMNVGWEIRLGEMVTARAGASPVPFICTVVWTQMGS